MQGSALFIFLQQQRSHNAVASREKHPANQQRLGQKPTVELGWTNLFLPSLSERKQESLVWGITSFLCLPAEGGICTDEHIQSV